MTIEPPTKSIADGHELASDGTASTATLPEQSITTPFSEEELKRLRLQVLDCVNAEENGQEAPQNHERYKTEEKASNQDSDGLENSSVVPSEPNISRNPTTRPHNVASTARLVPPEYRREKGVTQVEHHSEAGLPLRAPGAYAILPPSANGVQDESSNNEDDEAMTSTNNDRNEAELLYNSSESAWEAQIVPERRDLNQEVQQKMEAITIDPIAVERSDANNDCNGRPSAQRKMSITLMITLGISLVLVAIGITVGIIAPKNKNEFLATVAPTFAPTFVSDMELARAIVTPLSGNETLWDESSPQFKALWWIVHEDPAQMMTLMMQDETRSLSNIFVERYAMAVLYFATDGPTWLGQTEFLGNSSICDWDDLSNGIGCNDDGSAVVLSICRFVQIEYECYATTMPVVNAHPLTQRMCQNFIPLFFFSCTDHNGLMAHCHQSFMHYLISKSYPLWEVVFKAPFRHLSES
jgi:hypothetical protein